MKLIWNENTKNQNFAGIRGDSFVFLRTDPSNTESPTVLYDINRSRDNNIEDSPNAIAVENENVHKKVGGIISLTAPMAAAQKEREEKKRSAGNPMGVFLGSEFERQYWNPVFWFNLKLNTKNSFIKNLEKSSDYYKEMLSDSDYIVPNIEGSLFEKTSTDTIKLISRGGGNGIDNSSYSVFESLSDSVLKSFDKSIEDARYEKRYGQDALMNRETFTKIKHLSFWREARHRGMLDSILGNLKKARKEVASNIQRVRRKFDESLENTQAAVINYEESLETRSDKDDKKIEFWKFIKEVSINPAKFLNNPLSYGTFWREAFGTGNKYRVLDTIRYMPSLANKVVEFQKSRNLGADMESTLSNFDKREQITNDNLENVDFDILYNQLERSSLEVSTEKIGDSEFVDSVRRGLRKCHINIEDIFPMAVIRLSDSEKVLYIVKYLNENIHVLNNPKFPNDGKQKMRKYFFDILSKEEKEFSGDIDEDGTNNKMRSFALRRAQSVKDAALESVSALTRIQSNIRDISPASFQRDSTKIKSFAKLYDEFFDKNREDSLFKGREGKTALIEKLPQAEQESIRSLLRLKGLRDNLGKDSPKESEKTGIFALIAEKEKFDTDFDTDKLPLGDDIPGMEASIAELKTEVARRENQLYDMIGEETAVTFNQDSFNAAEKIYSLKFKRLEEWQNSLQKYKRANFVFPDIDEMDFRPMIEGLGTDLPNLIDNIPETGEVDIDRNNLFTQHFQKKIQDNKETEFSSALHHNMEQQADIYTRSKTPAGTKFANIEVTDVTQTNGALDFPEALKERFSLANLSVVRQDADGSLVLQDPQGLKGFRLAEEKNFKLNGIKQTRFHLEMWNRPTSQQGPNTAFSVGPSNPDKIYSVLNIMEGESSEWHRDEGGKMIQMLPKELRRAA